MKSCSWFRSGRIAHVLYEWAKVLLAAAHWADEAGLSKTDWMCRFFAVQKTSGCRIENRRPTEWQFSAGIGGLAGARFSAWGRIRLLDAPHSCSGSA